MILDDITAKRATQLEKEKSLISLNQIKKAADACSRKPLSLKKAISGSDISIIAEVKKASPSASVICEDFKPADIAADYEKAGAAAISCLTENYYFRGCLEYLREIRNIVSIPILRKDFIIDEYQIYESFAAGADAILLIAALLDTGTIEKFSNIASDFGLECLIEVHDKEELEKILPVHPDIIGINNRDLRTFKVSLDNTEELAAIIDDDYIIVSESGIKDRNDMARIKKYGADAALIGETLMRAKDKCEMIRSLKECV
ncbi:MAG: indole-3-glycerol phosphate synthase TrpC [Oscillospiraceae bacterium]|nr:indole-3-glycerol phosphate synthase TrpC [Oscillospiraceae bacterium]